jgi:hypothetical protein
MSTYFILLLICHWRWIWWRRDPPLERAQQKRLIPIIWEKKNLWIENLGSINPLKESTPILLGQENKLVSFKLHNIHTCELLLLTLLLGQVVSTSGHASMSWLFDVSFYMMITSQNEKMRRNRSISTTSVHVLIPIISHVNNKSYGKWQLI